MDCVASLDRRGEGLESYPRHLICRVPFCRQRIAEGACKASSRRSSFTARRPRMCSVTYQNETVGFQCEQFRRSPCRIDAPQHQCVSNQVFLALSGSSLHDESGASGVCNQHQSMNISAGTEAGVWTDHDPWRILNLPLCAIDRYQKAIT